MFVEQLDQLGEVRQRPGQAVDLVDHDDVDLLRPHLIEQLLQGRADQRGPRKGSIVEVVGDEPPALVGLALDIGLARLPLGVEGVEREVEIVVGGFARVDRAALERRNGGFGWLHRAEPPPGDAALTSPFSPKNLAPFQLVPVIRNAMVDRLV